MSQNKTGLLNGLKIFFNALRNAFDLLAPTSLQTLAAIGPIGAYFLMDQGGDVLSQLGESMMPPSNGEATSSDMSAIYWFVFANVVASLAIWWTARVALTLRFDGSNPARHLNQCFVRFVVTWWPRLLGVAPCLIIATAFFYRVHSYVPMSDARSTELHLSPLTEEAWTQIHVDLSGLTKLGVIHLIVAGLLAGFFIVRRAWLNSWNGVMVKDSPSEFELERSNLFVLVSHFAFLVFCFLFIILAWFDTLTVARTVNVGATFSLAAAVGVIVGTTLMHVRAWTAIPVLSLIVILACLFSRSNDNHQIRILGTTAKHSADNRPIESSFNDWLNNFEAKLDAAKFDPQKHHPIYVVATAGGGIRAAYWTALVLGKCQELSGQPTIGTELPDFSDSTFAISGVSGGSVGAAVFTGLLHDRQGQFVQPSRDILGQDHLSPLLTGLFFPEIIQFFWPRKLSDTDRATVFEASLEEAYGRETGLHEKGALSLPFMKLWAADRYIPHLLFNSTLVETGQPVIFSDLPVASSELFDAEDAQKHLARGSEFLDVPLVTAAHASARFTYTNPPGTFPDRFHFVDGGYFEYSGANTAIEIFQIIKRILRTRKDLKYTIDPKLILISNGIALDHTPKPLQILVGLRSPPTALFNAQNARGDWAYAWGESQNSPIPRDEQGSASTLSMEPPDTPTPPTPDASQSSPTLSAADVIEFHLENEGIPLPLGWSLSRKAARDMDFQLDFVPGNLKAFDAIRTDLSGSPPDVKNPRYTPGHR